MRTVRSTHPVRESLGLNVALVAVYDCRSRVLHGTRGLKHETSDPSGRGSPRRVLQTRMLRGMSSHFAEKFEVATSGRLASCRTVQALTPTCLAMARLLSFPSDR